MSLKNLVETAVQMLVEDSDAVTVEESDDRGTKIFEVRVAPPDVGRVIGKEGRVITCVRQLVGAAGAKEQTRAVVKVITDD